MIDYSFKNNSKDTLGFRIYNRYSWRAGAEMIISVADATSVDTKFQLRKFKKDYTNLHDMVGFIKNLTKVLTDEFPEGSTGLNIRFLEPKKAPVINVEMPSNFMYVGDEMKFTVSTENLEGKILGRLPCPTTPSLRASAKALFSRKVARLGLSLLPGFSRFARRRFPSGAKPRDDPRWTGRK